MGAGGRRAVIRGIARFSLAAVGALVLVSCSKGASAPSSNLSASDFPYAHAAGATTLVGTGIPGFAGDNGPASRAQLHAPGGIALDSSGNLFIADTDNCRVRMVPARSGTEFGLHLHAGDILTVAGGTCGGSSSDGEPGTVAVDPAGDLFIAFGSAGRVEELPAKTATDFGRRLEEGRLATIAGGADSGFAGDGAPAATSELDDPSGLAVDPAGDLLVSDTSNCRLRVVAATTGAHYGLTMTAGDIYTVAGTGVCGSAGDGAPALDAQIWDPGALAVDPQGDVFVADQGNRSIRVLGSHSGTFFGVTLAAGDLGTVAGEGSYGPYLIDGVQATTQTAEINYPSGIALDPRGDLYIADGAIHAIRFVADTAGTLRGTQVQAGDMYTAAGELSTGLKNNTTIWVNPHVLDPTGVAVTGAGRLVYSDTGANVVRELPAGT